MKRIAIWLMLIVWSYSVSFSQGSNARLFTIFTSAGCGCTGSGGVPMNFTTHDQVLSQIRLACEKIDFVRWEGTYGDAVNEV